MKTLSFLLSIFLLLTLNVNSQTRAEKKAQKKERKLAEYKNTLALVESGNFEFEASWAYPLGNDVSQIGLSLNNGNSVFQGNRVNLVNSSNFLKIKEEQADVSLPFFGRTFNTTAFGSSEEGIKFSGNVEDYVIKKNEKKHKIEISFNGNESNDKLKFLLTVTSNGNTTVIVTSTNRQTIQYTGKIKAYEDKSEQEN